MTRLGETWLNPLQTEAGEKFSFEFLANDKRTISFSVHTVIADIPTVALGIDMNIVVVLLKNYMCA